MNEIVEREKEEKKEKKGRERETKAELREMLVKPHLGGCGLKAFKIPGTGKADRSVEHQLHHFLETVLPCLHKTPTS